MKKIIFFYIIFLLASSTLAQDTIIEHYIRYGLEHNLALQRKQSGYQKSIYALQEAKGLFYPSLSFNARYSVADGGRVIDFPVGDLMNPVYQNLNQLNDQVYGNLPPQMQPADYPMIENEEIHFLRPEEHETKLRLTQPIFNTDIYHNREVKSRLTEVKKYDATAYKRQLIAEIKKAWFNYLKTLKIMEVLDQNKRLINENIRVNKKLHENNKVTIDAVYRSQAEKSKIEQKITDAKKSQKTATAYFNFLLNKPLDSEIFTTENISIKISKGNIENATERSATQREEIKQLEVYENLRKQQVKLQQGHKLPTLTGVVDYGFQGEEYSFTGDDDFVHASLVLQWDIFKGLQNKRKIQQAQVDLKNIQNKKQEVSKQLQLDAINTFYSVEAAAEAIIAAKDELKSTEKVYTIIHKKYKQGQASQLEHIDARTSLLNAQQNLIVKHYDYHIQYADFERKIAMIDLTQYEVTKENQPDKQK